MKLGKLLFGMMLLTGLNSYAQDDTERECTRMRFLAGEELKIKNYAGAASYYLKGEKICGGYDAANYARMIGTLRNAMTSTQDAAAKTAYADTLEGAYDRAEAANAYDKSDDLFRASNILQTSKPNRKKADELFRRGIDASGTGTNEGYVSYFYYNTYAMFAEAPEADKAALKKRMISEYFELSTLISKANMSVKTQETITSYFNYVVRNCEDILPELKDYITNLPTDPVMKKATVINFINLLDAKECTSAPEYIQLIDILVEIDPNSFDALMMKSKAEMAKKNYNEAIASFRKAKEVSPSDEKTQEIQYEIARAQFTQGSYTAAYNTALTISGEHRGNALIIAGKAVGQNANNCGSSTFERKCNNIYAVQLLQQGGADASTIAKYKSNYPTSEEIFQEGSPTTKTLSCYGVTVNL